MPPFRPGAMENMRPRCSMTAIRDWILSLKQERGSGLPRKDAWKSSGTWNPSARKDCLRSISLHQRDNDHNCSYSPMLNPTLTVNKSGVSVRNDLTDGFSGRKEWEYCGSTNRPTCFIGSYLRPAKAMAER